MFLVQTVAQKVSANQAKQTEHAGRGLKSMTQPSHIGQRGGYNPVNNAGYGRKPLPASTSMFFFSWLDSSVDFIHYL